jgi:hypothetical protein
MGLKVRSLQLGWLGLDHELAVFPHPDVVLNVSGAAGGGTEQLQPRRRRRR